MKKIIAVLMATVLMVVGLTGCKSDEKIAQEMQSEIQGWWLNDSGLVYGFVDDEYILYSGYISITGTFSFDGDEITMVANADEGVGDKVYTAKIEDDVLYLTTSDGETTEWSNVTEDDVRDMYLD